MYLEPRCARLFCFMQVLVLQTTCLAPLQSWGILKRQNELDGVQVKR